MDYLVENWGSFVGVLGLLASVGGLVYALLARRAAKSAEQAAREARQALSRSLSSVDIERAVALINHLKDLHRQRNWNQVLGEYQTLRRTLLEIRSGIPATLAVFRDTIGSAVAQVTLMANRVNRSLVENSEPEDPAELDEILNDIQQELETLQSDMTFLDGNGGAR